MQTSKLWSLLKDERRMNDPALMTNHFVAKTKMQGFKFSEGGSKIMNLPNVSTKFPFFYLPRARINFCFI